MSYKNLAAEEAETAKECSSPAGRCVVQVLNVLKQLYWLPYRRAIHLFGGTGHENPKHGSDGDGEWRTQELVPYRRPSCLCEASPVRLPT